MKLTCKGITLPAIPLQNHQIPLIEGHPEVEKYQDEVLKTIADPDIITAGWEEE